MLELSHPDDHEVVLASRPRLAAPGRTQHRVRFLNRDGSWRWLEAKHASVLDGDGVVRSASVVTWRDFTDEQVVAEQLARSEREYRLLAENAAGRWPAPIGMRCCSGSPHRSNRSPAGRWPRCSVGRSPSSSTQTTALPSRRHKPRSSV